MAIITTDIDLIALHLSQGKLAAIPTETVYGLAGAATDVQAVSRIYEVKGRPTFDPLIIHTHHIAALDDYIVAPSGLALELLRTYAPGPLTLLCKRKSTIPDLVTSGLPTVAVRLPSHPLCRALLQRLDTPIAAPSANPFGYISPTRAAHVQLQLGDRIDYILDGEVSSVGLESTVLEVRDGEIYVLRQGAITTEMLATHGVPVHVQTSASNPRSPGMLTHHYAPRTPLTHASAAELLDQHEADRIGYLAFEAVPEGLSAKCVCTLSPSGSLPEAARNLFHMLRQLDQMDVEIIGFEYVPDHGLGRAINDKLRRASAGRS